jgi:SAM-dependent methyltransferase
MPDPTRILELLGRISIGEEGKASYPREREFSRELDLDLGLKIEESERKILLERRDTPWAGLDPETLQTPYPEIGRMLTALELPPGSEVVDLGAAYGRMGLVIARFFPELRFRGFEISSFRAEEGARFLSCFPNTHLSQADVTASGFPFPDADAYFLYDFHHLESLLRVLDRIRERARGKDVAVIGRGRFTRDRIERNEPWLSGIVKPLHLGNFSIYRTR